MSAHIKRLNEHGRAARGSFTVETALLIPVILAVVVSVIYLAVHVHNRTYLTLRAGELAVTGHEQEPPRLFGAAGQTITISETKSKRTVSCQAATVNYNGRQLFKFEEEMSYKLVDPPRYIRILKAAGKLGQGEKADED